MSLRVIFLMIGVTLHAAFAERFALLVGNSNAAGDYATLKYVENDINNFRSILNDFCGFEKGHVVTLYNGTPEDLDRLLTEIAAQTSHLKNAMFLFYFSGHADQENLKMGSTGYSLATLKEKLTAFPSDIRIGIFDACQSGSFTRLKGGKLSEPFLFKDDGKSKGQVFLSSSSVSENSQEFDAFRNSIFTFHLINGLRGSADVSGDSRVTLSEAYQYAFNHTISSTAGSAGGIQHPSYQFRIQGEGDIVLADLNIRSQGVMLGGDLWGAVTIFNEQSTVVADFAKENKSTVMIALGAGTYRVVNVQGGDRLEAAVTLNGTNVATLTENDLFPVKPYATKKKGRTAGQSIVQWGASVAGVYERLDLSSLTSGLNDWFSDYNYFSLSPSFSFPSRIRHVAITTESVILGRFITRIGGSAYSFSSKADYAGKRLNEFDGKMYGEALHVDDNLSVTIIDLAVGYRLSYGYLNRFFLLAGLNVYMAKLQATSVFNDSLYNIRASGTETQNGTMAVPYIGAGYAWPVTRFCDIGAEARYRFQSSPKELTHDSYETETVKAADTLGTGNRNPLKVGFGGFDFRVYVNFNLKFGNAE
jgi:hypothetical protein